MSTVAEIVLFCIGLGLGIWWFSLTVLPIMYGFPRALLWATRGWAKPRGAFLYLIAPVLWNIVLAAVAFAMAFFLPRLLAYLLHSGGFGFGQLAGIVISLARVLFSRSTHKDLAEDFFSFMKPHLTPQGQAEVAVRLLARS